MSNQATLSIRQYNVRKSKNKVMASLLQDKKIIHYDILAIQKPWRNPFMNITHNPIPQHFELAYKDNRKMQVCFFINKHLPNSCWTVFHHSPNAASLEVKEQGSERILCIHNIYNPILTIEPTNSAIPTLQTMLQRQQEREHIVVGDFNLHHPHWGGRNITNQDHEAEELLLLLDEHCLGLLFQPGLITYHSQDAETTIDLALATPRLCDSLIICEIARELEHDSDHFPLETLLAVNRPAETLPERWSWDKMDREFLRQELQKHLPEIKPLEMQEDIDQYVKVIVTAIMTAVNQSTPKTKPSPRSIPGWTWECKEAQMQTRRLR